MEPNGIGRLKMSVVIFDTETSGFETGVVELGAVIITDSGQKFHFNERCKPSVPITPGAQKCHGISDADVENCRPDHEVIDEWMQDILGLGEEPAFVAHNLQFDRRIIENYVSLKPFKRYCSLQVARDILPYHEKHKLEFLYETLGFSEKMNAHSALDDCIMLERVLTKLLGEVSRKTLAHHFASVPPKLLTKVTFSKEFKGQRYEDLPIKMLKWIVENHDDRNAVHTAGVHLGKK